MIEIRNIEELKDAYLRYMLAYNPNLTKISADSSNSAIAYGVAGIAQAVLGEAHVLASYIAPQQASGNRLDVIASQRGILARKGAQRSSVWLRINHSTTATGSGEITFQSQDGISFTATVNFVTGSFYAYVLASSVETGARTNVEPFAITRITAGDSTLRGFITGVLNEVHARGGADAEEDDTFRERILTAGNSVASNTLERLRIDLESNTIFSGKPLLRFLNQGYNNVGRIRLGVITANLVPLTTAELATLNTAGTALLCLRDKGTIFENVSPTTLTMDARLQLSLPAEEVRNAIILRVFAFLRQVNTQFSKTQVERGELLNIVSSTRGVDIVDENFFLPLASTQTTAGVPITLSSVIVRDLTGNVLSTLTSRVNLPNFYE